jgi:tetratricopeptide (TPR) repeat protein
MAEDRPEEAERHFKAALVKAPDCVQAFLTLAQLEMDQQRYEQAAIHLAAAIEAGDERPQVYRNYLLALLHTPEEDERTKTAVKAALARHPSDAPLQQLADRYLRRTAPAREDR